jgi:hypothetical protein
MATEEDVAAGLMNWVNSLEVSDPVSTIDDLTDGTIIWKVLRTANILHLDSCIRTDSMQSG